MMFAPGSVLGSPHGAARARGARIGLALVLALAACHPRLVVGDDPEHDGTSPPGTFPPGSNEDDVPPEATWEWMSPRPLGATLRAVAGTRDDDVWLAGEQGAILHFDGTRVSDAFHGASTDTFYAVWAGGGEVWAAGDGIGGGSRIAHYDGASWQTDYSLTTGTRIHALWGSRANDVWAVVDDGERAGMARWDGARWQRSALDGTAKGVFARDIAGFSDGHAWVVGDGGTIAERKPGETRFALSRAKAEGSPFDPFDPALSYIGVAGERADDVWALFLAADGAGVSHWDGATWRGAQRGLRLSQNDPKLPLTPGPLREGRSLVLAGDRGFVNAWTQRADYAYAFSAPLTLTDGVWSVYPAPFDEQATLRKDFGLFHPPDGAAIYTVGMWGAFGKWEPLATPLRFTGIVEETPRFDFASIAPLGDGDEAYGTEVDGRLGHFTGTSWKEITMPPVVVAPGAPGGSPGPHYPTFADVAARAADDVWAVGSIYKIDLYDPQFTNGYVAHFDGTTWQATQLPEALRLTGVWANAKDDVWAVGLGPPFDWTLPSLVAFHFDGAAWTKVTVPDDYVAVHPKEVYANGARVFGLARDQVWITAQVTSAVPTTDIVVLRWNGERLETVRRREATCLLGNQAHGGFWDPRGGGCPCPRLFAFRADDLWLPANPLDHFDGQAWSSIPAGTDRDAFAVLGTRDDDLWLAGAGSEGGAIRHFDGAHVTSAMSTSPLLFSLGVSPEGTIWAAGQGSAALRLTRQNIPH